MTIVIVILSLLLLVVLIGWFGVNAFVAFLITSLTAGLLLGVPIDRINQSVQKGIGDTLGTLVIIISIGAMLGKLVAESGAAQCVTSVLMQWFGRKYVPWALACAGFLIGIPLFYGVGFVLMVPLIFSVVYQYKLPAVFTGLPMLAALSVTHGFLPPHPSPTALVEQFNGSAGATLCYGLIVAVPAIIIAGPVYALTLKGIRSEPLQIFQPKTYRNGPHPGKANSFFSALLPVILLALTVVWQHYTVNSRPMVRSIAKFAADPGIIMLVALLVSTYTLGIGMGRKLKSVMLVFSEAVKDIASILLIIAGAGALKQVLTDSGVSGEIAAALQTLRLPPLFLGWMIAAVIRVCIGSATIAGLTTAGIILPLMAAGHVNPNLMALSIGAGSLMFSHVNDAGFWMFKEYFNLSIKDTLRSWSVMETIVAVIGLIGVLTINIFIKS